MVRMLLLSLLLIGCTRIDNRPAQKGMQWFPQTCLKCGSEFDVSPVDPKSEVSRTVEWCFNDGAYCDAGLVLLQDIMSEHPIDGADIRFVEHCKACEGCKCAAYEPEEWHTLMKSKNFSDSK